LVNGTGRDHPRRVGLATHLGCMLDVPSIGVTHRPLLAHGDLSDPDKGSVNPIYIGDEVAGSWITTRRGARPLVVHPAWRTELAVAQSVVIAAVLRHRTPEPLREARRLARTARSQAAEVTTSG
jgi:deoxyribonuclease V